jgi:hypothetical protein
MLSMDVVSHSYFLRLAAGFLVEQADVNLVSNEKLLGKLAQLLTDVYLEGKESQNVPETITESTEQVG